jgi:hypothetical protein
MIIDEQFDSDFICSQPHDSTALDLFSDDPVGRILSRFDALRWSEWEAITPIHPV